jgi:uncharacterized membrane protein YcaP (DUF421 family)
MWHDLLQPGVPYLDKIVRTVAVYGFLLLGLRVAGKRELGQLNPFDLVVLLLLANTVQNAIIGNDNSLVGGLVGAAVLLLLNYAVVRFLYRHRELDRLAEGDARILVRDGKVQQAALDRELITLPEVEAAARRQGIASLAEVEVARIEVGGALTFVQRRPSEEEQRHRELLEHMIALERRIVGLEDRLRGQTAG